MNSFYKELTHQQRMQAAHDFLKDKSNMADYISDDVLKALILNAIVLSAEGWGLERCKLIESDLIQTKLLDKVASEYEIEADKKRLADFNSHNDEQTGEVFHTNQFGHRIAA